MHCNCLLIARSNPSVSPTHCGRGMTIDENSPRPPWENRLAPEPEPEEGKRPKKNKEILVDVELD